MKVAYLGPKGTFTAKAAEKMFPGAEFFDTQPIRRVILAVENGEYELGVVPIENFYNGQVNDTLDTLIECEKARIVRESWLEVVHYIGAMWGHEKIAKVLSKDQALGQCSTWLAKNYPEAQLIAVSSTGEAAKMIARDKMTDAAAIASIDSLTNPGENLDGLEILGRDICPNNRTRFFAVARYLTEPTGHDKTFLAIHPPIRDRPGVLSDILTSFSGVGINLEYIQSRPDGKKGYRFYVELDGHFQDENVAHAIKTLNLSLDPHKKHQKVVEVLGSYKDTHWKD